MNKIIFADNLDYLQNTEDKANLVYIDPPFGTNKTQKLHEYSYNDSFTNYLTFLRKRIVLARNVLVESGSFFVHLDYRNVHHVKVMLDEIFGRDNFMNEIIWAYDFGGRPKRYWPRKHDTILWYVMNKKNYTFNYDEMDRIPYMAPGLVGPEKAKRGKTPTDVWWHTIVHTTGKERTGYPTQKPLGVLERIVKVHTNPYDVVLDFFAGSGTTGEAAAKNGRRFILVDNNPQAIEVMKKRLEKYGYELQRSKNL